MKRYFIKTLVAGALALTMLGSLTACGACDEVETTQPLAAAVETTEPTPAEPTPAEPTPADPTAEAPTEVEAPAAEAIALVASASFTPGTFTAAYPSFGEEDLEVTVTFGENSIEDIQVTHGDTASWARRVLPTIPQQIIHNQSTQNIDTIASATLTSTAVLNAVNDAIAQAGVDPADLTPLAPVAPLPGATFIAGQYIVETTSWEDEPMIMQVVFSQDEIVRVQVLEHGDTTTGGGWANRAIPVIPHQVEEIQSTVGIDTIAGATTTSENVLALINEAITLAGANPANLTAITRTPGDFWPYGAGGGNPAIFHPGVYYATADGFGGPLTVQAIFNRGGLVRARVVAHNETEDFFNEVFPSGQGVDTLATIIEEAQTIQDIDVTAGATVTHNAFIAALEEAIRMAGADPADF